jgi:hypothetical protein
MVFCLFEILVWYSVPHIINGCSSNEKSNFYANLCNSDASRIEFVRMKLLTIKCRSNTNHRRERK